MTTTTTSPDALLLIAHGSSRYPDAARAVLAHAAILRAQNHFAVVAVGLLNGSPSIAEGLAACGARPIHAVPFFMEDGYFTTIAVPRALAGMPVRLYPAIGTHSGIPALIETRMRRFGHDPSQASLVLVGHGSAKAPGRIMALHRHAEQLRDRCARVEIALLEEAPFVADVLARVPYPVVIGLFAGDGMHKCQDLPAAILAAPGAVDLGSIGEEPGLAALVSDWISTSARIASSHC